MTDKVQKIREEVERLRKSYQIMYQELDCESPELMSVCAKRNLCQDILMFIDSMQEEPKQKMSVEEAMTYIDDKSKAFTEVHKGESADRLLAEMRGEEPVSEELEKAANEWDKKASFQPIYMVMEGDRPVGTKQDITTHGDSFKAGAKWQKSHLWKPADGDDLPEIDREVIVLVKYSTQRNIHDKEYFTYRVGFGHRPNHDGWDGRNIDTGVVTHYTPKLYDKGGWNVPDIAYWLDVELPKEIEL